MLGARDDSDRYTDVRAVAAPQLFYAGGQALAQDGRAGGGLVRGEHTELVAADPGRHVHRARRGADRLGHAEQELISRCMPE